MRSLAGLRCARRVDGAHMGRAISTVVRYELSRPPERNGLRRVRRGDGARCARAQWRQVQFTEGAAEADRGGATLPPTGLPGRLVVRKGFRDRQQPVSVSDRV